MNAIVHTDTRGKAGPLRRSTMGAWPIKKQASLRSSFMAAQGFQLDAEREGVRG
jgi:hypothetical protein